MLVPYFIAGDGDIEGGREDENIMYITVPWLQKKKFKQGHRPPPIFPYCKKVMCVKFGNYQNILNIIIKFIVNPLFAKKKNIKYLIYLATFFFFSWLFKFI